MYGQPPNGERRPVLEPDSTATSWPLSLELLQRLNAWVREWEEGQNVGIGPRSELWSDEEEDDWRIRGQELALEVQEQLGHSWVVRYGPAEDGNSPPTGAKTGG
jgi:hypothetical protein